MESAEFRLAWLQSEVSKLNSHRNGNLLLVASGDGHLDIVMHLLERGANVNFRSADKKTALHFAATTNQAQIIFYLLENGADINAVEDNGLTSLHFASEKGSIAAVRCLLQHGANPNISGVRNITPLHQACANGQFDIVKILLEFGAEVNTKVNGGYSALIFACTKGDLEMVKYLIETGADVHAPTIGKQTGLHLAAGGGYVEIVKCLTENGADVNSKDLMGLSPLHFAASGDQQNNGLHEYLVSKGVDVNSVSPCKGITPLMIAAELGSLENIKCLDHLGANKHLRSFQNEFAARIAVRCGHWAVVDYLVTKKDNLYSMQKAAWHGKLEELKILVQKLKPGEIDHCGRIGTPALHLAAMKNHLDVLNFLIEKGADVTSKDVYSHLLHCATKSENGILQTIIEEIRKKFVDSPDEIQKQLSCTDKEGDTPLMWAVEKSNINAVATLLQYITDIKQQNQNGRTALHWAANVGNPKIVQMLLKKDHKLLHIKDCSGNSPFDVANKKSDKAVMALLKPEKIMYRELAILFLLIWSSFLFH